MTNHFKKILEGHKFGYCWHCGNRTQYIYNWPDGAETFECPVCLARKCKVKRFKRLRYLRPAELKSLNFSQKSLVDFRQFATVKMNRGVK